MADCPGKRELPFPVSFERNLLDHRVSWTFRSECEAEEFTRWVINNFVGAWSGTEYRKAEDAL